MPVGAKKPVYAPYVEHMPPDGHFNKRVLSDRRYWPLLQRPHLTPSANLGLVASHRNETCVTSVCVR